ncbi:MAG: agmatinase [Proteobacteria bacterium]|nr:agmatinase [Pseudomonadota bacterium]
MKKDSQLELDFLPQTEGFLGIEEEYLKNPLDAKAIVVPFGLETDFSHSSGTRTGPRAIIKASHQIELFDEDQWRETFREIGIATLKETQITTPIEESLKQIQGTISEIVKLGKFPLTLGGEHSLTVGIIPPLIEKYPDLAILHFDAHANLKDNYKDNQHFHTSVFRRIMDNNPVSALVSCGIRGVSAEEVKYLEDNKDRIHINFSKDIDEWNIDKMLKPLKGRPVYISFDLDGFDSSLMNATGTPEPGGIFWKDAIKIIKRACEISEIVGADVVELSPIAQFHSCNFLAAKLCYKILSYAFSAKK